MEVIKASVPWSKRRSGTTKDKKHVLLNAQSFNMKMFSILVVGLQTVAAKVSYDGYKAFHIETSDFEATQAALEGLEYVSLNCESDHKTLEVAVAPGSLKAFEALDLNTEVTIEDVGVEIATEGELKPYKGKITQV